MTEHASCDAVGRRRPPPRLAFAHSRVRYGAAAMVLHRLIAARLSALVLLGQYLASLPDAGFDERKVAHVLRHKEIYFYALALASLRR